jgi:hypothetical protein
MVMVRKFLILRSAKSISDRLLVRSRQADENQCVSMELGIVFDTVSGSLRFCQQQGTMVLLLPVALRRGPINWRD